MTAPATKIDIRKKMRQQRTSLDPAWVKQTSIRIAEKVIRLPEFTKASTICCYLSLAGEVDTHMILQAAWHTGKCVAMPVRRDDGEYYPAWLTPAEPLVQGHFGLQEPLSPHWAKPDRFEIAIVPGVAFSTTGARLGHGRGYYDRMLARLAPRVEAKVGICFKCQLEPAIPMSEHDVSMDVIVTEEAVYRTR